MKPLKLKLVGLDGNAFALLAAFKQQAKREGWNDEEIKAVVDEAMRIDYSHLLVTIGSCCKNRGM